MRSSNNESCSLWEQKKTKKTNITRIYMVFTVICLFHFEFIFLILDKFSHDDKIRHLFVDIKFYHKNDKTLFFNEIYPPIFEC